MLGLGTWAVKYATPDWAIFAWLEDLTIQSGSLLQTHIVTAHVAVGALILATSAALALFGFRLIRAKSIENIAGNSVGSICLLELAL